MRRDKTVSVVRPIYHDKEPIAECNREPYALGDVDLDIPHRVSLWRHGLQHGSLPPNETDRSHTDKQGLTE